MHETERNRLLKEIRQFKLAAEDMRQARAAVQALMNEETDGDLCRALETAIVVCYARPFAGGNKAGRLGSEWEPPIEPMQPIHRGLLAMRDQVYAHNDKTDARVVLNVGEHFNIDADFYVERWMPLDRAQLPSIADLAMYQSTRFETAVSEHGRLMSS